MIVAKDIAGLIALAFFNRQVSSRTREKLLRWFLHDTTDPLVAIRDTYVPKIEHAVSGEGQKCREKVKALCGDIGDTADFLLAGFMAYGIIAGREAKWNAAPCDLASAIEVVFGMARTTAGRVQIQDPRFSLEEKYYNIDRQKVMIILLVLLENAIGATETLVGRDPWVRTSIGQEGSTLTLVVEDNGFGFEPELGEAILREGLSLTGESSGLGLAIVKRFAELAGGDVHPTGKPGEGATFTVRLPLN